MNKTTLLFLMSFTNMIMAQSTVDIEKKWIKNEVFKMKFFSVNDTTKTEIGKITHSIEIDNQVITQSMTMEAKMFKSDFIDITAYRLNDFMPIYHSSSNDQRLITVAYDDTINAVYRGTKDKKIVTYQEALNKNTMLYDSSVYQNIIRWLPLKNGYTQEIPIFNYDPNSQSGIIYSKIIQVSTEKLQTKISGLREVWKVTEQYGNSNLTTVHFIDKENRKLWKQTINEGKLVMIAEE